MRKRPAACRLQREDATPRLGGDRLAVADLRRVEGFGKVQRRRETALAAQYAQRVLRRKGSFAPTLHFAEPFDPAQIGDRKAITAEARRRILAL